MSHARAPRRALVTGAAGFLGAHLVERLLRDGIEVHGVSRAARSAPSGVRWHRGAFDDAADTDRVLEAALPDVVFHLGGRVTSAAGLDDVHATFASLLASTVHLLEAATRRGVGRVVLAGSYTEPDAREAAPSPYAAAKACASLYARTFHALYGTPVVVARIFMTYGPGQRTAQLVPYVITSLLAGHTPRLSHGHYAADWVYADDVAEGLLRCATRPALAGETVDLGSGRLTTVREVAERVAALVGATLALRFGDRPEGTHPPRPAADVARTRELLGWRPETSLDAGLAKTVEWYRRRVEPR